MNEENSSGDLLQTDLTYQAAENCEIRAGSSQTCTSGVYNAASGMRNAVCAGDSGGVPLLDSQYVQIGMTSYGWAGCQNEYSDDTAVFTKVADYRDWVDSVLLGTETPNYILFASDNSSETIDQTSSTSTPTSSGSSSSGGSISWLVFIALGWLAILRRRTTYC